MKIIKESRVRDGLTQVTYKNGLVLSIGSSDTHYSAKRFGIPLTVEVAIFHEDGPYIPLTEYDDVAQIDIAQFEHLTEKMERLADIGADEAAKELWHWAEY